MNRWLREAVDWGFILVGSVVYGTRWDKMNKWLQEDRSFVLVGCVLLFVAICMWLTMD